MHRSKGEGVGVWRSRFCIYWDGLCIRVFGVRKLVLTNQIQIIECPQCVGLAFEMFEFLTALVVQMNVGDDVVRMIDRSILDRSEEHTSELQSRGHLVCRLLLEKKNDKIVIEI